MKIEYDREVDALYILLKEVEPANTRDLEEGVTIDVDEQGHIVGVEILDASERLGLESLLNITIHNMPVEPLPA